MPEISRFLGIVIAMFYSDHAPPHFRARYGAHEVIVRIADGAVEGDFPRRALGLLLEWYALHREGAARQLGTGSRSPPAAEDRALGVTRWR